MGLKWWNKANSKPENKKETKKQAFQTEVSIGNPKLCPVTLTQFQPAWKEQAYLRFSGIPYKLINSKFYGCHASGFYPQLFDGHFVLPKDEIMPHLIDKRVDIDKELTKTQLFESKAIKALVEEVLDPLLLALKWSSKDHIVKETVVRPMKKVLPNLFSMISPSLDEYRSMKICKVRNLNQLTIEQLLEKADEYYGALEIRLDDNSEFLFGGNPSSVDAVLFGHLANALVDFHLITLLPKFLFLTRFFNNIVDQYFSDSPPLIIISQKSFEDKEAYVASIAFANHINQLNAFNQIEASRICTEAAPVKDPFAKKRAFEDEFHEMAMPTEQKDVEPKEKTRIDGVTLGTGITFFAFMYYATWFLNI
mmetsp:Transcript_3054/g.4642  ORF Transcript_3054/g.4642 Transcript_3054/m.4642 type:complete len:365 (+) Transcript_3054:134-1228(+)|eukprot:CAMPEP_0171459976 /NCGR_PEP_ID=MMETSP0945-20130129/5034_1 /TAXON_ID=109269 /ORGANISM="Vaucheria litorea, Strain CCMP2940" /LENGTH=364 /DNA_ID=CAMNT_0011986081 /DNA_START=120 /DNA_END=1214 /DNA_ORIENTATION=-